MLPWLKPDLSSVMRVVTVRVTGPSETSTWSWLMVTVWKVGASVSGPGPVTVTVGRPVGQVVVLLLLRSQAWQ